MVDTGSGVTYQDIQAWIALAAERIHRDKDLLTELDAAIGDADHGINMDRGFQAVATAPPTEPAGDIGALLKGVGMKLISTVGGASGPLYGTFFLRLGAATAGRTELTLAELADALDLGVAGVAALGKAAPGDKTMLDALAPARDALRAACERGEALVPAIAAAVAAAEEGMHATIRLVARKGRASYLGERSAGHQDPGATSSFLLLQSAADAWPGERVQVTVPAPGPTPPGGGGSR